MNGAPGPVPLLDVSLDAVQSALRKTTEALAGELTHPSALAPDWTGSEWLVARAVAAIHGVSPLLSRSLRWQGPPGWSRFLHEQRIHTEKRYRRIQELMLVLDAEMRRNGIALVALKGAALHALNIYVAGERPMADLDLLVPEGDSQRTCQLLEGLGFHQTYASARHRVFEPDNAPAPGAFGENSANGVKIELHSHIQEPLPRRKVDISAAVFPRQPHPGLNDYPSKAALMTHVLLHAAGAMSLRSIRLLNLHDISRLSACMSGPDWDELLGQEKILGQTFWWAFPPLALTARYCPCVPDQVLDVMSARCQWLLKQASRRRTLSDVSLSHLWVSAFPGIEWARSPREMLAYAADRVAPGAEMLSLRKVVAKTQPDTLESRWANLSQSRRILRWLRSRPPRDATLRPVQMAMTQSS
jgi:hypothetical protein